MTTVFVRFTGSISPRFARMLSAHAFSQLGVGFHLGAFPLLVSSMTSDPVVVAATALATTLPGIILALPIGAWVDRAHRGRLMIGSDLSCAAILFALTILVATGDIRLWMLFAAAGLLGSFELVFGVSTYALLPNLVIPADLTRANSLMSVAGQTGAGIVGPALGGVTYGLARFLPFLINTLTYLTSAVTIRSFAGRSDTRAGGTAQQPRQHGREELFAGIRYVRRNRPIRALIVLSGTAGFFGWMPEATFVLFAREHLGVSTIGFGVLLGVTTLGAIGGGLLTGRLVQRLGTVRTLVVTYTVYGVFLIPVGLTSSSIIAGVLLFFQGLPLIACDATVRSLQQAAVPNELLGRVGAVNRLVHSTVVPLGLASGGIMAGLLGYPAVWLISGCGFIAALLANIHAIQPLRDRPESNAME